LLRADSMSWRIVIDKRRSLEDFDYWHCCPEENLWYHVFNPVYSREKKSIGIIDGALFVNGKEIIF